MYFYNEPIFYLFFVEQEKNKRWHKIARESTCS